MVTNTYTGDISEGLNLDINEEGGGVILPTFLLSATLGDCKDKNDGYIYDNDEVPNHDYRIEDGSLADTGAGKGEFTALDGVSERRIAEGRK